ncbi:glycosyltransferase family 2 protein [Bacteroides zhangwenhongii]|jgi:glycosyltransferase|uniref:glycosyltransferase family 2 protein n=1 Tax=Bacteroides zhangwenhongii TaxID=2650157 RepID=UPI0032C194BC
MLQPKVSVIVPIFKVSQYIEKCAISLFEQTLDDIEYLFIDDCSPDNSVDVLQAVLNKYPQRRDYTRIIRMNVNSGTSVVRALGIKEAKGEYIIHCDSDDWVDVDYFEKLYKEAIKENADIVIGDFIRESINTTCTIETEVCNPPRLMLSEMCNRSFYCMLWNKLMRRPLLIDNAIRLKPGINMWEDVLVCLQAFYFAKRIGKIEGSYYHYRVNPESYTVNSANECSYWQRKCCVVELEKFFADKEGDWSLLLNYWKMLAKLYLLLPACFNPYKWRNEFSEAAIDIDKMGAFSEKDKTKMKMAVRSPLLCVLYTMPDMVVFQAKRIVKSIMRR